MDKYLLQILLDVNTIIIPGLGALTVTNAKTGEMMFMSYLKYDDGKLAAYISEKERMSVNDAKNLIAKYVREIQTRLDQGQTYDMYRFGRFLKNKDGDTDFESWSVYGNGTEEANAEKTELPVENAEAIEAKQPEPEAVTPEEQPAVTIPEPEIAPEITSIPEFAETTGETRTEDPATDGEEDLTVVDAPAPTLDDILGRSEEEPQEPVHEETVVSDPIADQTPDESRIQVENIYIPPGETAGHASEAARPEPEDPRLLQEPGPKKKRGAGFWTLIIVISLLVLGGTATLLFYDKVKAFLPFLESKRVEAEKHKDSVMAGQLNESAEALESAESERISTESQPQVQEEPATAPVEAEKPQPVAQQPVQAGPVETGNPYHVIAGAFGSKENADRFAAKNNFTVLGQYDNMYLVSSGSYASRAEAQSAMNGKGWVFRKK